MTILNSQATSKTQWFVCFGCNLLYMGRGHYYYPMNDYGEERVFCDGCLRYCTVCKMRCPSLTWEDNHWSCLSSSSSLSSESEEDKEH